MVKLILIIQNAKYRNFLFCHFTAVIVMKYNLISNRKFPTINLCCIAISCRKDIIAAHQLIVVGTSICQIFTDFCCFFLS